MPRGRPKGSPNKYPKALQEMILGALGKAGGEEYLRQQAQSNPAAFLTLIGKVLPLQVNQKTDMNGKLTITWKSS